MLWIGLTGGIATGKSEVSQILAKNNIPVVDADILAREVVSVGTEGLAQIEQAFGPKVLLEDGSLHRKALAQLIFNDSDARLKLEAITHPAIQKLREQKKTALEEKQTPMAFYDVPLLFEKKMQDEFHKTVLVYCQKYLQLERLMKRDGISLPEAEARIQSQLPIDSKRAMADVVIVNDGTIQMLDAKVSKVLLHLQTST